MQTQIEEVLTPFFKKYRLFRYEKGEIIYRPGEEILTVAFAKSGFVRLYTISKEGKEITTNLFKPLFYLTLIYSNNKMLCRHYFECVTPVELWKVPKTEFIDFIAKNPEIAHTLNNLILRVLENIIFDMENIISGNSYKKTASIIASLAKQYGVKDSITGQVLIDFSMTHEILASLTGLTRETTSLQIKKLRDKEIIVTKGKHLIINNPDKLQNIFMPE